MRRDGSIVGRRVLRGPSASQYIFFLLLIMKKIKRGSLRCDREVRLLVSDGLRHDEWVVKRGGGRE